MMANLTKYQFSGHETFPLRQLWLMKAVHHAQKGRPFIGEDAMIELGVGKNMVASMVYWAHAANFLDSEKKSTPLANQIFGMSDIHGFDPYGESITTAWLVHWNLATNLEDCSAFWFLFNMVNKSSFTRNELFQDMFEFAENGSHKTSESTIKRAVEVCLRSYVPNLSCRNKEISEEFVEPLLGDLGLLEVNSKDSVNMFRSARSTLCNPLFAYALLDYWQKHSPQTTTLNFNRIMHDIDSPGRIFKLDENTIASRLESLEQLTSGELLWIEQGGIRTVLRKGSALSHPTKLMDQLLAKAFREE